MVSACTTQIRVIFYTLRHDEVVGSIPRPSSEKDLSATVYSSFYRCVYSNAGYVHSIKLCAIAFQNIFCAANM